MNTQPKYGTAEAVAFLNGTAPDAIGRTIEDYLAFDMDKWEECHNHVQWAFPNNEASMFNPNAPVVDMQDFANQLTWEGRDNVLKLATTIWHRWALSPTTVCLPRIISTTIATALLFG